MKNLTFLIIAVFSFSALSAQTTSRNIVNKYKKANQFELLEVLHQKWEKGIWVDTEKDLYTHDETGVRIKEETFQISDGVWQPIQKTHYNFDEQGNRIEKRVSNLEDQKWLPVRQTATTYNYTGQKTSIENLVWEDDHWTRENRYELKHNEFGTETIRLWEVWDRTANRYLPKTKITYQFSGKTITGTIHQTFKNGSWENVAQSSYGNHEGFSTVRQTWNNGSWTNDRRDKYTTNEFGQYVLKVVQKWNGQQWANSVMHVYQHDEYQNISQEIVQHFSAEGFANENKYNWIYSRPGENKATSVSVEEAVWHIVYPNPFTFETTIKFSNPKEEKYQLEITDLQGKLMQQVQDISSESYTIKRGSMVAGVYVYKLSGSHEFQGRIVVQD